jgi:Ran-binding protein 1
MADSKLVTPDMKLSPNVGSDRSWVWNVAADVSEGEPEAQTLAIRFANSESRFELQAGPQGHC